MAKISPSYAEGVGSIPGQEAEIPHTSWPKSQNIKQKQYCNKFNKDFKNSPHPKNFKTRILQESQIDFPTHWSCFYLPHYSLNLNIICLKEESIFLALERTSWPWEMKQKVKSMVSKGWGWGKGQRPRNQHHMTQALGTWSVMSRKTAAMTHRQDARSFPLWIRTMLPCPGWLTEGEPGYQVFPSRPADQDDFTWRNHLRANFPHCHSCWDPGSMKDWNVRFWGRLAWHWKGTACSLLKLSSEQLGIL